MKRALLLIILHSSFSIAFSQAGMWTWMKGDSLPNKQAVLGTKGVPDMANTPAGIYEAAEWTDTAGNFWLLGGLTSAYGASACLADLWRYNPVSNEWTWLKGSGSINDLGIPGTKGVPGVNNRPKSRGYGAQTWTSKDGNLWLYGGNYGTGQILNDLWRYNIATNMWTWMQGNTGGSGNAAVLGIQGIPSALNSPGAIAECSATWIDSLGNLWMFGGIYSSFSTSDNNRLWRYNVTTNQWTWMKGDSLFNAQGVYGIKGVADPANTPGARTAYTSWKDKKGNFWLYGGESYGKFFNDMWMYNPGTNNWTWMSGTDQPSDTGDYSQHCSPSQSNFPSGRYETRSRWTDKCGNFWLYAGARGQLMQTAYSDLWFFNPRTLAWRLVEGDSANKVSPTYETQGVPSANTQPGCRAGSVGWFSRTGELYLFGGGVLWPKMHNDVWKYTIDTACLGSTYCSACVVTEGGIIAALKDTVCKDQPPVLHFSGVIQNVQWQYSTDGTNYNDLVGLTGEDCLDIPTQTSYYRVKSTDGDCSVITEPKKIVVDTTCQITGLDEMGSEAASIFPNPGLADGCSLLVAGSLVGSNLEVFDANGRVVFLTTINLQRTTLSLPLPAGVYFLRIQSEKLSIVRKFIRL